MKKQQKIITLEHLLNQVKKQEDKELKMVIPTKKEIIHYIKEWIQNIIR